MMTVDHGWRKPRIEHSTRTWRPATQIVRVRDLQVTVIADDTAAFDAHWPVLDLDCGDAFSIDTLAAGRSATVHARVCDQSRRVNGTHGTIGRGVALAQPMVNSRGAAEPIPPGTRLLGFAIVAKAPVCDEPTRLEIEAWLREHDIGSGNYGSMEVGSTYLFVDAERSPAWLVNTPSFIEDHRGGDIRTGTEVGSKGAKAHTRWKEVWRNTGANRPTRAEERDGEEEEEAFDEEAGEGTGTRECRRVGVAMAVRAGEMWELSQIG